MADNMTQDQKTQSNPEQIRQFFEYITQGWNDLAVRGEQSSDEPLIELRCISSNRSVNVQRFAIGQINEAVQHAAAMNSHGQNVYMCINPIDGRAVIPAGKAATDKDILAAMFCFADADTDGSMANVLSFAGPKFTMSVKTGTTPYVRGHAYWQLEEPCINLDAWRQVQASIAASLGTDPVVINPSRIMRVAGTVSYPNKDKQGRGYIQEMVTMRTEFSSDRDPVPFERMMRAFRLRSAAARPPQPASRSIWASRRWTEQWQRPRS